MLEVFEKSVNGETPVAVASPPRRYAFPVLLAFINGLPQWKIGSLGNLPKIGVRSQTMLNRRQIIGNGAAAMFNALAPSPAYPVESLGLPPDDLGPAEPFSFDELRAEACRLASLPYSDAEPLNSDLLEKIDYDAYQKIRYRQDRTLRSTTNQPIQLFHLGRFAQFPVRISIVTDGQARAVRYGADLFDIPEGHPARSLPSDIGFAGFRIMEPNRNSDWFSMIGASYFRSSAPFDQYGLSARGIAINTATGAREEFPRFTHLWLEWPSQPLAPLVIYALLNGPSTTGAYRIEVDRTVDEQHRSPCNMVVEAEINLRTDVERVGIAPFSSMFWYGEAQVPHPRDWRPEIHDSDGLALLTGSGERLWRPLRNPSRMAVNVFEDRNPKGFGLLQRDRAFDHYLDDGVFYEKRPSVWVEPIGEWGEGAVHLVEIPTGEETWDNIVAYWCPRDFSKKNQTKRFAYKLHWLDDIPLPAHLARAIGTWTGIGGPPGLGFRERRPDKLKIVVDFEGEIFAGLTRTDGIELIVTNSRGTISAASNYPIVGQTNRWRAVFDVAFEDTDSIDLRAYLRSADRALTETWIYQLDHRSF
jgi:periplasmic glucans biosynthesis protein